MEITENSAVETTNLESAPAEDSFLQALCYEGPSTVDEPVEATTADQPAKTSEPASQKDSAKDYPIKYKGKDEVLHLTDDQHTALLQKGRDYDEVRRQRDELLKTSQETEALIRMRDYYAANNGLTPEELIEYTESQTTEAGIRAQIAKESPDLSEDLVNELVESRMAKYAAAKNARQEEETAAEIEAFKAEYPNEDIENLPSDVEAYIQEGMKLLDAYRLHELKELRKSHAELNTRFAALQKEKDNHFRSVGRVESKAADVAADSFVTGLTEGGY